MMDHYYFDNVIVHLCDTISERFINVYQMIENLDNCDLVGIYGAGEHTDELLVRLDKLKELDDLAEAGKSPKEIREASQKLGSRFVKTVLNMDPPFLKDIFRDYVDARKGEPTHHAVAYGVLCAAAGVPLKDALECFLYSNTSNLVVTSVKTIPLSQTDGQKILISLYDTFGEIIERAMEVPWEQIGLASPGFDLRCMQHEVLYSRLYMS